MAYSHAATGASGRYTRWAHLREGVLRRARDCSKLTLPSLVPPLDHNVHSDLPTPHQGVGAAGVTNLASKLLMTLFSVPQPWFRLLPTDPEALIAAGTKVKTEVEVGLARIEKVISAEFEIQANRVKLFEALKHLLVAGNVALHIQDDLSTRVIPLDQYVCRRDPLGKLLCLIVKEPLDADYLPSEIQDVRPQHAPGTAVSEAPEYVRGGDARDVVCLYTCVEWDAESERYHVRQELSDGTLIPGSVGSYPEELLPWRVLRYVAIDGEDYGRGMVEEVLGDLISLEGLTRAIVEAAAIASRCVGLVNPAGAATATDLNNAPNGAYVVGREGDVTYPLLNKSGDLAVVLNAANRIEERLHRGFLLNTAVQRNAERVTAEEIRYVAQELESTLGGVFSVLSQELQLPLVRIYMDKLGRKRKIPKLAARSVRPAIVTGIEALGRGQELGRLTLASQTAQAVVGPEAFNANIDVRTFLEAIFTAAGSDPQSFLKSEEEVAAAQQQAYAQALAMRAAPNVVNQVGPGVAARMGLGAPEGGAPASPAPPAT